MKEINDLDDEIKLHGDVNAYNLSRRGALLRKIGKLLRSQEDLELAIKTEPHFLDAYWQRHLLYLLQGDHYVRNNTDNYIYLSYAQSHGRLFKV